MQVLGELGELAWFKLSSERHPLHGYQQLVFLAWRFKDPQEGVAEIIEHEVDAAPTQVDWTLVTSERNWYLTPSRVANEIKIRGNSNFNDITHEITTGDQEFCMKALVDFESIIRRLEGRSRVAPNPPE